jgi:hypothetical protein
MLVLAVVAAAVCLSTAVAYLVRTDDADVPELGLWLGTLAALGGSALGAVGLWQFLGDGVHRLLALVVLSALAAAYVAANVLALLQPPGSFPDPPRFLHVAGTVAGAVLYAATLVVASRAFSRTRHVSA